MNPTSASLPAVPNMVNGGPVPQPATAEVTPATVIPVTPAAPNVMPIPVHTQQAPVGPVSEDIEFDKIMQDVGQQIKKEDDKPQKHGFLGFGHKPKPLVKVTAQPIKQPGTEALPVQTSPVPSAETPFAIPVAPAQPQAAALPQPKTQHSVPVFVIFVAFLVTGFLVAAAIAAYRQT